MRVLVTGATGFIGPAIVSALRARGDAVVVLTRERTRAARLGDVEVLVGEIESTGAWQAEVGSCDGIVHLAGEPIAGKRWNGRVKQQLRDSRVEGTRSLVEAIERAGKRPRVLVSASGADYYPFATGPDDFDDDTITEADPPGDSFLSRLCRDWEREATDAEKLGVRVVRMRTGLVLGPGGAQEKMSGPFRFFVGGPIGNGRQWISWVHRDDVVAAYLAALTDDKMTGAYNLVAASTRARDFARTLGAALGRPSWLPVPGFAVRAAAGELADYLLHGRNVVPARLRAAGFRFQLEELRAALSPTPRPPAPARTSGPAGSGSDATP